MYPKRPRTTGRKERLVSVGRRDLDAFELTSDDRDDHSSHGMRDIVVGDDPEGLRTSDRVDRTPADLFTLHEARGQNNWRAELIGERALTQAIQFNMATILAPCHPHE